jgi:hypothetical protein
VSYGGPSSVTFLVSSDLAYTSGQYVYVYLLSNHDVNFQGQVLSYEFDRLEITNLVYVNNFDNTSPVGPYEINLTGMHGPTGPQGDTGLSPFTQVDDNTISYTGTIQVNTITGQTGSFNFLVIAGTNKPFIMDHPVNPEKYLVHVCLEGPEAGVYYRGKSEITNHVSKTIELPNYVETLATDLTVQVTPIYNGDPDYHLQSSEVENNQFIVYGSNGKFHWIVHGKRNDIIVEPLKIDVQVKGDGPYKWI